MIDQTINFVRDFLYKSKDDFSIEQIKYRFEHSLRVGYIAREIAEKENANILVSTLAGILHDVGTFVSPTREEHARVSAKVAKTHLETLNLSKKIIDDICYAIACHYDRDAGYEYEKIIEADIVGEADNIDRFSVLRVYLDLKYANIEVMDIDDLKVMLEKRISKLTNLINNIFFSNPTSTKMFHDNLKIQLKIYQDLLNQYNITNIN